MDEQELKGQREVNIAWMYHNIMDLYGDKGNIIVFKNRCEQRGIKCNVTTVGIDEWYDFTACDIFFMGGGADKEQEAMYNDLLSRKDDIKRALDGGMLALLICGGYQLFGKYYQDADGNQLDGLGIFNYHTVSGGALNRSIGNIVVETNVLTGENQTFVGFENHGGRTYDVDLPFAKVLYGQGNERNGYEGYFNGNVLGTYMHGPLLPKNVEIADYFIKKALLRKGYDDELAELDDKLANEAKQYMINRCMPLK